MAGLSAEKWLSMLPAVQDNFNRAKLYGELNRLTFQLICILQMLWCFGLDFGCKQMCFSAHDVRRK